MPFDDAHIWMEQVLPERESLEFQQGKFNALLKLLPYARSGSREAASVVLKLDGSEFDFAVGDEDAVESQIPRTETVAHLHTHPENWGHSEQDWGLILNCSSVEQTHVIAPHYTYSLHKPRGWNPVVYGIEEVRPSDIEGEESAAMERNHTQVNLFYAEATIRGYEQLGGWNPASEGRVREWVGQALATRFGMVRRIGHRRKKS